MKKIKLSEPLINYKEFSNIKNVLKSGWLTTGGVTLKLENNVKKLFKVDHALAVNSCTNGLHVSLVANGIGQGDEVVTSPFTFVSTINNLYHLKTKIILADIQLSDYNIDIDDIKKKVNARTKCILPIHYSGNPANLLEIIQISKKKNIKIIEDAACAFGAKIKNQFIGSHGTDSTVFSLYGNKVITSGEGGIVVVKDKKIYRKIKELIFCGMSKNIFERKKKKQNWFYNVNQPGFKYNISDIQSAIALAQLGKLKNIINYREKIFKTYNRNLEELIQEGILKPIIIDRRNKSSHYIYTLLIKTEKLKCSRDRIGQFLSSKGIGNTVHYIPAHKHNFYKKIFKKFNLKNCDYVYDRIITLPMHNKLNQKNLIYICNQLNKFIKVNYIKKNY